MAAGDITYSHPAGAEDHSSFASGKVLADIDAVINVLCGFQPSAILLFGTSDNEATFVALWFKGVTAGTFLQLVGADAAASIVTTYGPIVYAGDAENGYTEGFTIPIDFQDVTGLNMADSDPIYWMAWR